MEPISMFVINDSQKTVFFQVSDQTSAAAQLSNQMDSGEEPSSSVPSFDFKQNLVFLAIPKIKLSYMYCINLRIKFLDDEWFKSFFNLVFNFSQSSFKTGKTIIVENLKNWGSKKQKFFYENLEAELEEIERKIEHQESEKGVSFFSFFLFSD